MMPTARIIEEDESLMTREETDLERGMLDAPSGMTDDDRSEMMDNEPIEAVDHEAVEENDTTLEVMEDEPVEDRGAAPANINHSIDISVTSENCKIINESDQAYSPCPDPEGATNIAEMNNGMNRNDVVPDSANLTPVKLDCGLKEQDTFTLSPSSPTQSHDDDKVMVEDEELHPLSRRQQRLRIVKCYAMVAIVVLVCAIGIPLGAVVLFKNKNDETSFSGLTQENNSPSNPTTTFSATTVESSGILPPIPAEADDDDSLIEQTQSPTPVPEMTTDVPAPEIGAQEEEDDDDDDEDDDEDGLYDDEEGTTDPPVYEDSSVSHAPVMIELVDSITNVTVAEPDLDGVLGGNSTSEPEVESEVPVEEDIVTEVPSYRPTSSPSAAPSVGETQPLTPRPTGPDRTGIYFDLINITSPAVLQDTSTPQALAYLWLVETDQILPIPTGRVLLQRYILVIMDHVLHNPFSTSISDPKLDHCLWEGIVCDFESGDVKEINWRLMGLNGTLPEDMKYLDSLDRLDLSENSLGGTLDYLYEATSLKHVYLHDNNFTGSLTEQIGQLQRLESLYLSHNQLEGNLPISLRSSIGESKPLKWLVLSHNKFTGYIPPDWRMRNLFYLDLGYNDLMGPLPLDWDTNMIKLRHLFLDHNQFTGQLPEYFSELGKGRIKQIHLNDNNLEGKVPDVWLFKDQLTNLDVHNNNLTVPVAPSVCELSVFELGAMVELRTDCDICTCDFLCEMCVGAP